MPTMNISLPENLKEFVESRVQSGDYSSISEFMRELVRREQKERLREQLEQAPPSRPELGRGHRIDSGDVARSAPGSARIGGEDETAEPIVHDHFSEAAGRRQNGGVRAKAEVERRIESAVHANGKFSPSLSERHPRNSRLPLVEASEAVAVRFEEAVQDLARTLGGMPGIGVPCSFRNPELHGIRRLTVTGFENWLSFLSRLRGHEST